MANLSSGHVVFVINGSRMGYVEAVAGADASADDDGSRIELVRTVTWCKDDGLSLAYTLRAAIERTAENSKKLAVAESYGHLNYAYPRKCLALAPHFRSQEDREAPTA